MHRMMLAALAAALAAGSVAASAQEPESPRGHVAGHVRAFDGDFLTVGVHASGDPLRAHVTGRTRIRCRWLAPSEPEPRTDEGHPCDPRLLRPGTPVLRARLALIPRGAVWTQVTILVRRSTVPG